MTTKIVDLFATEILFPYSVSPTYTATTLGYINSPTALPPQTVITVLTPVGSILIPDIGTYSVSLNVQADLTSTTVPQMYWASPILGSIGFSSVYGAISDEYCNLTTTYYVRTTASYTQTVNITIPASQLGLVTAFYLNYTYVRIA
jgi:hypothetical protein